MTVSDLRHLNSLKPTQFQRLSAIAKLDRRKLRDYARVSLPSIITLADEIRTNALFQKESILCLSIQGNIMPST